MKFLKSFPKNKVTLLTKYV